MELIWRRLRQKLSNRSCTSSSRPTASAWTNASKDTPPTPATPTVKEDDVSQRVYNLPIPFLKAIPDNYERDNNEKDDKIEGGEILVIGSR